MNAEEQRVHDKAMDLVCSQGAEIERLRAVEAYAVPRHEVCNELIRWLDTKGSASTVTTWGDQPGETIRRLIENFRDGCPATCRTDDYPGCGTCMAPDDNRCPQPPPVVPRVGPRFLPKITGCRSCDRKEWMCDEFEDWFTAYYEGESAPKIDKSDLMEAFFIGNCAEPPEQYAPDNTAPEENKHD